MGSDDVSDLIEFVHTVSFWEFLTGDVLRLKIPRARCGVLLAAEPGAECPGPDGPRCPRCAP
jgi:hypothetical protein